VSIDAIKSFSEYAAINNIQNTFHDHSIQNHFAPLEKVIEIYEQMLAVEREKIKQLESQLRGNE
jgi:hypothetical protein